MSAGRGTVAVTGAGGFLGRALVPALLDAGYAVRALVRTVPPAASARVTWVATGDLAQAAHAGLRDALAGCEALVHLAAQAHRPVDDTPAARAALQALNVDAAARLAQAAAEDGVRHIVFASSVKVHGERSRPGHPLRENDPLQPADAYGASKVAAEAALARVARDTGLRVTALRLPLVYGPGAKANFAALIRAVRRGAPLPVASIDNRRSLLATGNFTAAVLCLLASDGDGARLTPYLLSDAAAVSTPELVCALAAALGVTPRIVAFPVPLLRAAGRLPGIGERVSRLVDSLEVDATAFRTRFAWAPPATLAAGLAAAVQEAPPV